MCSFHVPCLWKPARKLPFRPLRSLRVTGPWLTRPLSYSPIWASKPTRCNFNRLGLSKPASPKENDSNLCQRKERAKRTTPSVLVVLRVLDSSSLLFLSPGTFGPLSRLQGSAGRKKGKIRSTRRCNEWDCFLPPCMQRLVPLPLRCPEGQRRGGQSPTALRECPECPFSLPAGECRYNDEYVKPKDCIAHSVLYDIASNSFRPLFSLTNTWCSSGSLDPNLGMRMALWNLLPPEFSFRPDLSSRIIFLFGKIPNNSGYDMDLHPSNGWNRMYPLLTVYPPYPYCRNQRLESVISRDKRTLVTHWIF